MAFCKNCGTEIPEGTKFCPNCGAPTGDGQTNSVITDRAGGTGGTYETGQPISDSGQASYQQGQPVSNNGQSSVQQGQPVSNNGQSSVQQGQPVSDNRQPSFQKGQYQQIGPGYVKDVPASGINKYGKFFGIALFILSLAVFLTDPPFIRIILSAAIIAGAVFCISRKYKLKGFSIAAIVFAVLCLFGGVSQAKNYGMFTTPRVRHRPQPRAVPGRMPLRREAGKKGQHPRILHKRRQPLTHRQNQRQQRTRRVQSRLRGWIPNSRLFLTVMRNSSMSMLHL